MTTVLRTVKSFEELLKTACKEARETRLNSPHIIVGYGTCGVASGAEEVLWEITKILEALKRPDVKVQKTGCIGCCSHEVMVDIELPGQPRISYEGVTKKNVSSIVEGHLNGNPVTKHIMGAFHTRPDILALDGGEIEKIEGLTGFEDVPNFFEIPQMKKQQRIMLRNVGLINPEHFSHYICRGGYRALIKCLEHMKPSEVVEEVKKSGLRGRGGAGFPTGLKWQFARGTESDVKYVVCNADEGDPGAFMDRALIEGDPHSVLEGMMICGYAIGAAQGFIYIRAEYPLAITRLEIAMTQLRERGLLGEDILGIGFSFDIQIRKGAGAFVCGEETALMNSIMGLRGEPRPRPPYPAVSGLWGKPTNINNVKTLVAIPAIIAKGAEWFNSIGTDDTAGTAVFALAGDVVNAGLAEVPMGTSLREIIFEVGGGIKDDKKFKAVQTGGPSGGCISEANLDRPVDFGALAAIGSIMGSGGMIVISEDTCIVDLARFFLSFTQEESCGKCVPCREGTLRALEILQKICDGNGELSDLDDLEQLCHVIKDTSLCGLGQTAPNPVLSTLQYFREEYLQHIVDKECHACVCSTLYRIVIEQENCRKCGICQKICPVHAVTGNKEEGFEIDQDACIRCRLCLQRCPDDTIITEVG